MHISYQPLWDTLKERGMRKEDLRLAAGLTTNMIANMGKGEHISMKTLLRICGALDCDISDVIALEQDESPTDGTQNIRPTCPEAASHNPAAFGTLCPKGGT